MSLFIYLKTQTMPVKSNIHNSIAMFSLKTLNPGAIRNRVFCSWGGWYFDCTTPPGLSYNIHCTAYFYSWQVKWTKLHICTYYKNYRNILYTYVLQIIGNCLGGRNNFVKSRSLKNCHIFVIMMSDDPNYKSKSGCHKKTHFKKRIGCFKHVAFEPTHELRT
jgi:hypothetical protein